MIGLMAEASSGGDGGRGASDGGAVGAGGPSPRRRDAETVEAPIPGAPAGGRVTPAAAASSLPGASASLASNPCPSCGIEVKAGYVRCPRCKQTLARPPGQVAGTGSGTAIVGRGVPWTIVGLCAVATAIIVHLAAQDPAVPLFDGDEAERWSQRVAGEEASASEDLLEPLDAEAEAAAGDEVDAVDDDDADDQAEPPAAPPL